MKVRKILFTAFLLYIGVIFIHSQAVKPDIIVAQDGSGNYKTVTEAVNAVPDNNAKWFVIFIKNGVYKEVLTVDVNKTYIRFTGESAEKTVITFDNYHALSGGTEKSSSVFFRADNIIAENITFANNYDYFKSSNPGEQAVALTASGDRHVFINCRFKGYQDTLFVKEGRKYFKKCYIEGITDFIFGNGTAFFDECEIHLFESTSYISAPSTLEQTQYGLIFTKCFITAAKKSGKNYVYLGRPWHPSSFKEPVKSNAVFLYCDLGNFIQENAWTSMGKVNPDTERFFEYKNKGKSAVINAKRPQLTDADAALYTASNILKGADSWDPETLIAVK